MPDSDALRTSRSTDAVAGSAPPRGLREPRRRQSGHADQAGAADPGRRWAPRPYRHDITALRALAIVCVMAFHLRICFLSGGFAGVDVFFVVSGYLMTAIIWDGLETGSFSLVGFYLARIRRIVPALAVLCASLLLIGSIGLDPFSFAALGEEARSALLFYSNVVFWLQTGYFDRVSATKVLLQTWSLSLEWQFYIVYPWVLMLFHRSAKTWAKHLVLFGAVLSFGAACYFARHRPAFAFYMLPTRGWEMAIGGLPYLYRLDGHVPPRLRAPLAAAGLAAIVLVMVVVDPTAPWPGWTTLPVAGGTSLLIVAGCEAPAIFGRRVVQALGRWSYSIYLWHWPILVLLGYSGSTSPAARLAAIPLILVVAAFSYRVVEQRGFRLIGTQRPRVLAGTTAALAACVVTANAVVANEGYPGRFGGDPRKMAEIAAAGADWAYPAHCSGVDRSGRVRSCSIGHGTRRIMLFGDSFAQQLYPQLAKLADSHANLSVSAVTLGGCPPVPGVNLTIRGAACPDFNRAAAREALGGHYAVVVIASIWAPYFVTDADHAAAISKICFEAADGCDRPGGDAAQRVGFRAAFDRLADFASALRAAGTQVILVGPTPSPDDDAPDLPAELGKRAFFRRGIDDIARFDLAGFRRRTAYVMTALGGVARRSGATLYDPTSAFCGAGSCPTVDASGLPLYRDRVHLRSSVIAATFGDLGRMILDDTAPRAG